MLLAARSKQEKLGAVGGYKYTFERFTMFNKSKRDVYKSGYKQGVKGDFIGNVLHDTFSGVTGNMFGSKTQGIFNKGHENGQRDRRDSRKRR